ncbi:transposase [Elysia marginata]|uniref:Transposase n=1 Tax=Elysia marginata TaxID=1093978 RepID=A0AAV4ETC9_9GAST|nr:transposase [Elysia marginata]
MEEQLNTLNIKSKEVGLKMHKGKAKFMTNYENDDTIQIENASIEKVQKYKYLGKSTCMKDLTKEEVDIRIRAGWSCFGRNREILQEHATFYKEAGIRPVHPANYDIRMPNMVPYQDYRVAQRAMDRKILGIKIKDKIPCKNIRQQTHIKDVVLFAERQKWNWAGHVARMSDNRYDNDDAGRNDDYGGIDTNDDGGIDTDDDGGDVTDDDDDGDDSGPPLGSNSEPGLQERAALVQGLRAAEVCGPPRSTPDLAPCDFRLFTILKDRLAGRKFDRIQDLAKVVNSELRTIPEEDYQGVFRKWQIRLKLCIESHGEYFEGL